MPVVLEYKLRKESRSAHFDERSEIQFIVTLTVLMSVDDKCFSIRVHTLVQLFSPSISVVRINSVSLSLIDSRNRDVKFPDQYGELLQWFGSSNSCDIAFDLKVVFTIRIYSFPSSIPPLKMGTLNTGIFVSVF